MQMNAGGGEMKLTLTPEHLGEVTIQVKVTERHVTATLASDTPEVRQWMTAHQDDLRRGLTGLGLTLDEVVVKDDGRREEQRQPTHDRPRRPRRNAESMDSEKAFEVLV
jgi:flagellar hook-length control protein FliK